MGYSRFPLPLGDSCQSSSKPRGTLTLWGIEEHSTRPELEPGAPAIQAVPAHNLPRGLALQSGDGSIKEKGEKGEKGVRPAPNCSNFLAAGSLGSSSDLERGCAVCFQSATLFSNSMWRLSFEKVTWKSGGQAVRCFLRKVFRDLIL